MTRLVSAEGQRRHGLSLSAIAFLASILLGGLLAALDASLDAKFFSHEGFLDELLSPSPFEVYIRGFILAVTVAYGFVTSKIIARLEKANAEIQTLRGIITMCAVCNRIRDDAQRWHKTADYISSRSDAKFSHGLCPDCEREQNRELDDSKQNV